MMESSVCRLLLPLDGFWQLQGTEQQVRVPMQQGIRARYLGDACTLRRRFILPFIFLQERCSLYAENLSVPASIYLNGCLVHRQYAAQESFDVACNDLLQIGENEIVKLIFYMVSYIM